eukprot:408948-Rhodomonas_salina.1
MAQVLLQTTELQAFILSAPRTDLLSANREGLLGCVGYSSIFFAGVVLGRTLFEKTRTGYDMFIAPGIAHAVCVRMVHMCVYIRLHIGHTSRDVCGMSDVCGVLRTYMEGVWARKEWAAYCGVLGVMAAALWVLLAVMDANGYQVGARDDDADDADDGDDDDDDADAAADDDDT